MLDSELLPPGRMGCIVSYGFALTRQHVQTPLHDETALQAALARSEVIDFHQTLDIDGIKVMTMHEEALCTKEHKGRGHDHDHASCPSSALCLRTEAVQ